MSDKEMGRRRKVWQRRKEIGYKVLVLVEKFGKGVLLLMPRNLTAPSFGEMNKATVDLFVHGLAHAPWAENFQMLCSQGTSFLESLDDTEEPNGIKFKVTKLIYGMKANDPSVGLNTAANLRQLNHIIDQYPVTTTGMWISTVNCTPVRKEMETLRDEEEISDEIINAIFSL